MRISLLTDAPKHNLALMKLSAYHKSIGDEVYLNKPILLSDYRYASMLFKPKSNILIADEYGGPATNNHTLPDYIESLKPDYDLYNLDYSLGYTYRPCFNDCDFCKVPKMNHPDIHHHSIWEFHNPNFKKICILNNNTFQDPKWKETFEEIWDADLTVIDENGYDLRLLDDEKAHYLKKTKFQGYVHFAWDRMQDQYLILNGLRILKNHKLYNVRLYVLIGYNTTIDQDLYRCQKIIDYGYTPYIMPYIKNEFNQSFKRFIDTFMWRKYTTITEAWNNYRR